MTWLPPDGIGDPVPRRITKASDPPPGIFAVRADGLGLRPVTMKPPNNLVDYMGPTVAPDGSRISFARFIRTGCRPSSCSTSGPATERPLPEPVGTDQHGGAVFSPDGKQVAYSRSYRDGAVQLVVAPADGTAEGTALGPRMSLPTGEEPGVN